MTSPKTPSEESLKEATELMQSVQRSAIGKITATCGADILSLRNAIALTIDRYKERIREGEKIEEFARYTINKYTEKGSGGTEYFVDLGVEGKTYSGLGASVKQAFEDAKARLSAHQKG